MVVNFSRKMLVSLVRRQRLSCLSFLLSTSPSPFTCKVVVAHWGAPVLVSFGRSFSAKRIKIVPDEDFNQADLRAVANWAEKFKVGDLPVHSFQVRHSRSSGPGGQNINKVSTKVELRFELSSASWIPEYTKRRLHESEASRITKNGEFVMTSDRHRYQEKNHKDCLEKIHQCLTAASYVPEEVSEEKLKRIEKLAGVHKQRIMAMKTRRKDSRMTKSGLKLGKQ